ncbi:hypothetical protein F4778DRAFT_786654 [Xylariomycetidae sp. FL2044]|nr:hypothetical protein F4778DRAFT_786654 [Xylariomycetidae sp. FL2044]
MPKERDSETASNSTQPKRPGYNRQDSDYQAGDPSSHQHHRNKKHVVGGGGRLHSRVPSSKALHRYHNQSSTTKLNQPRPPSQSPERPPMLSHTHRRATSDLKLPRDSSASNLLARNSDASHLRRNRSHGEVAAKRSKSGTNIKRSSSHKDVQKLKGPKSQVHFDLGNDGQEDEWVDASASASPYMSRRASIVSSGQSSAAKAPTADNHTSPSQTPTAQPDTDEQESSPDRKVAKHNNYITSRLLQRTPSHGAPPQMSTETASVPPRSTSPASLASQRPPSLYGTPKTGPIVGSGQEELTSRFVNGSGPSGEAGSFFTPTRTPNRRSEAAVRRPQSTGNLTQEQPDSMSDEEDDSALAPRTRRTVYKVPPAEKSRTQQKLNLQRASSTMEPTQSGGAVGVVGQGLLVGGSGYENRDPRIGKLLERTGMEYLVVRRYQNPIARSLARISLLPGVDKRLRIPRQQQNGAMNGAAHGKKPSDLGGASRLGLSQSLVDVAAKSRPTTPRRTTSIRTNGANSSYDADEERIRDRERMSGSSYVDGDDDDGVAALLRNLWDKNMDLGASQD